MKHWLFHSERLEYADIELEPDVNVPLRDGIFNLYFGLHNIFSDNYDQELVEP